MGWCRVNHFGLIGADRLVFCFYQRGMLGLWWYKVFSVDSCFINK